MPLSIKVNLRVTGHCNQGGRKYMEDMFSVAYQQTSDDRDLEYAFFGIFDGHGGGEAAKFAKEHLMDIIVKQKNFWSDKDEDVLRAIRDGYVNTHYAMWRELDKWPRTASGLPSTAGTTASIAFIRKGKIYIGHVGDSGIVLGYQDDDGDPQWKARPLTKDHKPESGPEMTRIQESGGKVISKSGVPRVVWNRPRIGHKGPVRRSTHIDEIPFLAVARSLGDLWSYNSELDTFVVSPEPDVKVIKVDVKSHRCLIFGTDGLWNMLTPQAAVSIVQAAERHNEKHFIASQQTGNIIQTENQIWINPSKSLVDRALERWSSTRLRADNTSVVTLMIDPPGPSEYLLNRSKECNANLWNSRIPRHNFVSKPPQFIDHSKIDKPAVPNNIQQQFKNQATTLKDPKTSESGHFSRDFYLQKPMNPSSSIIDEKIDRNLANTATVSTSVVNRDDVWIPTMKKNDDQVVTSHEKIYFKDDKVEFDNKNTEINEKIQNPPADNTKNVCSSDQNIQVAEVSSSNVDNLDKTKDIEEAFDENNTDFQSTDDKLIIKNDESTRKNSQDQFNSLTEKLTKDPIQESFDKKSLLLSSFDDMHQLKRQNAFIGSCPDFKNIKAKMRQSTAPILTPALINDTKLMSRSFNEAKFRSENIKSSDFLRRKQQKDSDGNFLSKLEFDKRSSIESTRIIRRREITVRPGITTRTREIVRTSIASVKTPTAKRRHSSTFDVAVAAAAVDESLCGVVHQQEPCLKRRTRSEDRKCPMRNENNPNNQKQLKQQSHSRLRWVNSCSGIKNRNSFANNSVVDNSMHEKNIWTTSTSTTAPSTTSTTSQASNNFQRRSLEKKATPVKTVRRPSINCNSGSVNGTSNGCNSVNGGGCSSRLAQLRSNLALKDWDQTKSSRRASSACSRDDHRIKLNCMVVNASNNSANSLTNSSSPPQRWLRSDTIAATPIKTLRSRNVDIAGHTIPPQLAHQYGIVKQNRHSLNTKLNKIATNAKIIGKTSSMTITTTNKLMKSTVGVAGVNGTSATSGLSIANTVAVIAKRVKSSSYNATVRSRLGTRSRLKRLSK